MYQLFIVILLSVASVYSVHDRIFGGADAVQGQFPFAVAINSTLEKYQICDGVILNNRWILTAATPLVYIIPTIAVAIIGSVSLANGNAFNISQIIMHEKYDFYSGLNDIALIQLENELKFDENIQPIDIAKVEDDQNCIVMGWGTTTTVMPDILQFIETKTINEDLCRQLVSEVDDTLYLGPEMLCTLSGKENVGICYGDWGGPLVCDGKLVGIIRINVESCGGKYPDIYVRASSYVDWIQQHITGTNTSTSGIITKEASVF